MAESVAVQYGPTPGDKNAVNTVGNATTTAKVKCLAGVPGCNRRDGGVNGIVVQAQSKVPTWFGRIIGITELTVNATATAFISARSSRSTLWSCSTGRDRCVNPRRAWSGF